MFYCKGFNKRHEQNSRSNPAFIKDYGPEPFVVNIENISKLNSNFRTAAWTGKHLQMTLMCINPGEEIGLEMHQEVDQFLCVEQGQAVVLMGDSKNKLDFRFHVYENCAFFVPAGKWHNLINNGNIPIKLFSIYAPPNHSHGTIHKTTDDALHDEH